MACAGSSAVEPLSWKLRLKIAIGAARGLAFLHSSDDNVIYRDIKASNILLDGVSFIYCLFFIKIYRIYKLVVFLIIDLFFSFNYL